MSKDTFKDDFFLNDPTDEKVQNLLKAKAMDTFPGLILSSILQSPYNLERCLE